MSENDHEPVSPANEAETPREARGASSYLVTIAALNAALAEPLPADDEALSLQQSEV